jgi:predicted lipoprotein with Yx(FWY)xxD motif
MEGRAMSRSVLLFSILGSIVLMSVVHGLTLTPVWEITRPESWADIAAIGIHFDGSGDPLVVCRTDSGVITIDHTGTVSTVWTFTKNDSVSESAQSSASGRYLAIITSRASQDSGATVRVIEPDGTVVWQVDGTPYWEISVADQAPWTVSSMAHVSETIIYQNLLIKDSTGSVVHEKIVPEHGGASISDDGNRISYVIRDTIHCIDSQGNLLWSDHTPAPSVADYWPVLACGTPSDSITAILYQNASTTAGRVIFRDWNGTPSGTVDVDGGWGPMDMSADGEYVALGVFGTFYLIQRTGPSIVWSVTDPGGHRARLYRSGEISADGSIVVCGVSRKDSLTSRLEIYDNAGTALLNEQYAAIGRIWVEMTPDATYLVVMKEQLTALGRDQTLTLYQITM